MGRRGCSGCRVRGPPAATVRLPHRMVRTWLEPHSLHLSLNPCPLPSGSLLPVPADYLPSFLSHSHAQARGASAPAPAPEQRGGGATPLGGCLSPYFISDAAAKAAPAVVNIMVQAGGSLPVGVGSSGSGFLVDADGGRGGGLAWGRAGWLAWGLAGRRVGVWVWVCIHAVV